MTGRYEPPAETSSPALRRGHVTWLGRTGTVWHALPANQALALCGRPCAAYPNVAFDREDKHACVDCVAATEPAAEGPWLEER